MSKQLSSSGNERDSRLVYPETTNTKKLADLTNESKTGAEKIIYPYRIKLSKSHIEIDKKVIHWSEINETYIMQKQVGRGRSSNLIIFTNDRIYKFSLFRFQISDKKLSTFIEFFKQRTNAW